MSEQQNFTTLDQAFSLGNGQDSALNWLRKTKQPVAIFLISGIKLEGTISGFDPYCILLTDAAGNQQMVYKAKVSTISQVSHLHAVQKKTRDRTDRGHDRGMRRSTGRDHEDFVGTD